MVGLKLFPTLPRNGILALVKRDLKIISGGQTGVDRAALEWALHHGIPCGGWCPRGRRAEDGIIPPQFQLKETDGDDPVIRTHRNVQEADGTVIFSRSEVFTGGTAETARFAREIGKPLLHLTVATEADAAARQLGAFLREHQIAVLNVAGPRQSEEGAVGPFVHMVLSQTLKR
jgi:hypothetical protein